MRVINVNYIIMQMVPSVGPSLCLNPRLAFWVTTTTRVTSNWFAPSLPHGSSIQHFTCWRLTSGKNQFISNKKKDHLLRLAHTSRFVVERCCLAAWEPALKLLLGYKLTYTSTIRLSETIMKDRSGWRLAQLRGWKAGGVLTDTADVLKMTPFI